MRQRGRKPPWKLEEVLKKAVDLFLLLASEKSGTKVQLAVIKQGDKAIIISLSCPYPPLDPRQQPELFTQYYGSLQTTTNLKLGSGLEGFIIKSVTSQLNIPLNRNSEYALRKSLNLKR